MASKFLSNNGKNPSGKSNYQEWKMKPYFRVDTSEGSLPKELRKDFEKYPGSS